MTNLTQKPVSPMAHFERVVQSGILWVTQNQERFWAIIGVVVVTTAVGILVMRNRTQMNEDAWNQLGTVQGMLMQGNVEAATKSLGEWDMRFQGTSASSYAQFIKADLAMKTTDYASAARIYDSLATSASPATLRPLAFAAQVNAEALSGNVAQAKMTAQAFLDKYPDHFMAATVLWAQANMADQAGDANGAAALYERFSLLYPQNPWGDILQARKGLAPAAVPAH